MLLPIHTGFCLLLPAGLIIPVLIGVTAKQDTWIGAAFWVGLKARTKKGPERAWNRARSYLNWTCKWQFLQRWDWGWKVKSAKTSWLFLEKNTAYSFLLTLVPFLLLHTYKNGPMLNAWSFSFGSAVLGSSAVCGCQPKHHLAKQRRPTCPSKGMVRHWLRIGGLVHDMESLPCKRTKQKLYSQYQVWVTLTSPLRWIQISPKNGFPEQLKVFGWTCHVAYFGGEEGAGGNNWQGHYHILRQLSQTGTSLFCFFAF